MVRQICHLVPVNDTGNFVSTQDKMQGVHTHPMGVILKDRSNYEHRLYGATVVFRACVRGDNKR